MKIQLGDLGFDAEFMGCEVRPRDARPSARPAPFYLQHIRIPGAASGPAVLTFPAAFSLFSPFSRPVQISSGDDETWEGVAFRYFEGDTYYVPIIKWAEPAAATGQGAVEAGGSSAMEA